MRSLHARHQHGPRPRRAHRRGGRDDRGGDVRHVPAARDREVRRALRHPAGARRAGALPRGARHRVQPGLRRRAGHGRLRTVRRGLRGADPDRGRELPDAQGPADVGHDAARPGDKVAGQPAQLGRQGNPAGLFPPAKQRRRTPEADREPQAPEARALPTTSWPSPGSSPRCCLGYPDEALLGQLDLAARGRLELPRPSVGRLRDVPRPTWSDTDAGQLQGTTSTTFDTRSRCSLFLTYFAHGDTRKRGMALLRFKQTYLRSGFALGAATELPDHLGVVLEFAGTIDQRRAGSCSWTTGPGLELLRLSLETPARPGSRAARQSPPRCRRSRRRARRGTSARRRRDRPSEEVGLAPFAPPSHAELHAPASRPQPLCRSPTLPREHAR